jgi:hypothetical protein
MPLSQRPSPVTLIAVTEIVKPADIPTVNLMECAPLVGQGVWAERQSKVAMTEEFGPGANVQICAGGPSLLLFGTHPKGSVSANAGNDTDKQHARILM